jgi:rRNA maturation endonuclease Nob1
MARKKKVVTPVIESQEESVVKAPVVKATPAPKHPNYKCIECGQENETKKCKRCGSSLVREV